MFQCIDRCHAILIGTHSPRGSSVTTSCCDAQVEAEALGYKIKWTALSDLLEIVDKPEGEAYPGLQSDAEDPYLVKARQSLYSMSQSY